MYKCPKCKKFASMGPGICWKCGATLEAEPAEPHQHLVLHLRPRVHLAVLNRAHVDVTHGYVGVIGGKEEWTVTSPNNPQAVVSNLAVRFSLPNCVIGSYVANDRRAVLTPFICLPSRANFYWGQAGVIQVTLEATVLGQRVTEQFTVTVLAPTLSQFTAQVSASAVRTYLVPSRARDPENCTTSTLAFGNATAGPAGIAFTVAIDLANLALAGEITLTQILRVDRRKLDLQNAPSIIHSPGFVVDREFNYGFDLPGNAGSSSSGDDESGPLAVSVGQYNLTTEDSPSSRLGDNGNRREITQLSVNEEFRMYVMYRPAHGVWVALGEITWWWSAIAVYDPHTNRFIYQPGANAMANIQLLPNLVFTRFPLWDGNADDYLDEFV